MARSITGSELLSLFEWTEHELIEAVQGGLCPYDTIYGKKNDYSCLYCDGGMIVDQSELIAMNVRASGGLMSSRDDGIMDTMEASFKIRKCTRRQSDYVPWLCRDEWKREAIAKRLLEAKFLTAEVQEYALSHGLPAIGQDFTPQNAPAVTPGQDQQAEMEAQSNVVTLPTPPGVPWDQIQIRIAKNDRFEIWRPGYKMEFYNTKELGIAKARCKLAILKGFAHGKGKLKRGMDVATPQNISNLRKTIKSIFPDVEGEPIIAEDANYKRNYVCLLKIVVDKEEYSEELYKSDDVKNDGEDYEDLMDIHKPFYIKPREE